MFLLNLKTINSRNGLSKGYSNFTYLFNNLSLKTPRNLIHNSAFLSTVCWFSESGVESEKISYLKILLNSSSVSLWQCTKMFERDKVLMTLRRQRLKYTYGLLFSPSLRRFQLCQTAPTQMIWSPLLLLKRVSWHSYEWNETFANLNVNSQYIINLFWLVDEEHSD